MFKDKKLMATTKQISGRNTDEIWRQVAADLSDGEIYEYDVLLVQDGKQVELEIDIDLGGGFEGGSAYTSFTAPVVPVHDFRFAMHHQGWIDTAGKFFGMEDVEIGYPEFDDALIIKTNDRDRVRRMFTDVNVREIFQSLGSFTLHLESHHAAGQKEKQPFLVLNIEAGITDSSVLRNLYEAFSTVLDATEAA